jgi:hypothetical protein
MKIKPLVLLTLFVPYLSSACQTQRSAFFENENVKVWSTTLCQDDNLGFHLHKNPRVIIPDTNGTLGVLYKDEHLHPLVIQLTKNTPVYLDKNEGISDHQDFNLGSQPLTLTVIELKKSG